MELDQWDAFGMTHVPQSYQKPKLLHAMAVPVCIANGLNGQSALPNVQGVSLVVCNTMIVDPIQLLKSALVVRTDGPTGHYGRHVHQRVLDRE